MYTQVDKDRVRRLAQEIIDAVDESDSRAEEQGRNKRLIEPDVYTTVEVARLLGVSAAWVTAHVREFPGAFRLSEGQRANYRFPREGVDEYKRKQAV